MRQGGLGMRRGGMGMRLAATQAGFHMGEREGPRGNSLLQIFVLFKCTNTCDN